ncbi:unnamed protein product [Rhizophagus irregularis]|nr:unnamed protein product [Rhizophagus irregularis]
MSNNRHACIAHHNKIPFYSRKSVKNVDEINISLDSKDFHARRLHNRWHNSRKKNNISNRLGIAFSTRYSVNNINNILRKGNTYIYNKVYDNFNLRPSKKANVHKRQQQRFERKCRKIFHACDIKKDAPMEEKFLACKKKKFLFCPSQNFKKPISHLRYKKKYHVPLQNYYNFKLPTLRRSSISEIRREVHIANYFDSNIYGSTFDPSYNANPTATPLPDNDVLNHLVTSSSSLNVNAQPFTPKVTTHEDKGKKLKVNANNWISAMEALKAEDNARQSTKRSQASTSKGGKDADEKRQSEKYIENLTLKWDANKVLAQHYESFCSTLTHYQNVYYDYFSYLNKQPIHYPAESRSVKKGKKTKFQDRSNDSLFNPAHLEMLNEKKDDCDLHLALTLRDNALYFSNPSDVLVPRVRKRPSHNNFNLDSHYDLHTKKKFRIYTDII